MADSGLGQRKYKMSLEYRVVPNRKYSKNEDMSEDTEARSNRFLLAKLRTI